MTNNEIFSERLRVAMARADVGVGSVADHMGVTRMAVYKWANGANFPSSAKLVQLARFLDCGVDWLMTPERVNVRTEYDRPPPRVSDRSGEAGETRSGSTEGESAVPRERETPE